MKSIGRVIDIRQLYRVFFWLEFTRRNEDCYCYMGQLFFLPSCDRQTNTKEMTQVWQKAFMDISLNIYRFERDVMSNGMRDYKTIKRNIYMNIIASHHRITMNKN